MTLGGRKQRRLSLYNCMGFPDYNFVCEALFGSSAHVESVCTAQNIPPKCRHKAVE